MAHKTMEHHSGIKGILLWVGSMFLNIKAYIDRDTVTFWLGTTLTVFGIIHYAIQIRKNLKSKKDEKIS